MEYKELKEFLKKCSDSYYKDSFSLISDFEFDQKLKELEKIEEKQGFSDEDSPTRKPGSDLILSLNNENRHKRPMLSLENTYTEEEVEKWFEKMKEFFQEDFLIDIENKFDGGSASILFKDGKVIKALTRGDGEIGELITENVKLLNWRNIKKDFSGEVRGELIITKSGFSILNSDKKYQNARNLLSGSMKLLDQEEFKLRAPHIKFIAYWNESNPTNSHSQNIKILKEAGFETSFDSMKFAKNFEELKEAIKKIENEKEIFDFDIDGAVLKIDDISAWKKIGSTSKFPRWAKAFKYKQEQIETTVTEITFEIGRTGKITPLCFFEPVFIDGSTITKATLNNEDFMKNLDIGIGDKILVQKAACIIPQIVSVIDRNERKNNVIFPTHCPICNSLLEKNDDSQADYFCKNLQCPARICDSIYNFTHSLEIDGFAEIVINKLFEAKLLNSISDIYDLKNKRNEMQKLERFGKKMVDNLLNNIEKSKSASLEKLIAGLGIKNVGPKLAKTLAKKFLSIKDLENAKKEDFLLIEDIGEIVADSILEFFSSLETKKMIEKLKEEGVNLSNKRETEKKEKKVNLEGKSFCITGALSLKREDYENFIESCGGKVISSVSQKTSFLITNDKESGTSKNKQAKELNIPIINEREFLEMYGEKELLEKINKGN